MSAMPKTSGLVQKLQVSQLERLAIVYVRQSTMQQVKVHQESTQLQYGLVERAQALGWQPERVLMIDDDLGKSGSSSVGRLGYQRLVAEVSLGHVGLILGTEMSRLARSNKDWHGLLEVCALFNSLIADQDGIYDPSDYNDRLLLGLKGSMSEAELHVIKQRMHEGKLNKVRRGELSFAVPSGYLRHLSGEIRLDPDEEVQAVVSLIFSKFEELGSLHALLRYLSKHQIKLGIRRREGEPKGELLWRSANRMTLQNLLKNPIYAGAYAYGRRQVDARKKRPEATGSGRVICDAKDYHALIKDHFPAYISWAQYEANLARLKANQAKAETIGAVRHGPALLAGLLVCGHCGKRMFVRYGGPKKLASYLCGRATTDYALPGCQYLAGEPLDRYVSEQLLKALEPASLELSLEATKELETEQEALKQLWHKRLERAEFEVQRAQRHYRLVEPENRLVARQLAQDWEVKLVAQQQLQQDYQRFLHDQARSLNDQERERIRQLAKDIPALWHAQSSSVAQQKEILRQVIKAMVVSNPDQSERVSLSIEWFGGSKSTGIVIRPVASYQKLSYYPRLCQRLRELHQQELSLDSIAKQLEQEGFHSPKQQASISRQAIHRLLQQLGLRQHNIRKRPPLKSHEWWLSDLASHLGCSSSSLHLCCKRGELKAYKHPSRHSWVITADEAELAKLKQRTALPPGHHSRHLWLDSEPPPFSPTYSKEKTLY